jgi:hypothetical protein
MLCKAVANYLQMIKAFNFFALRQNSPAKKILSALLRLAILPRNEIIYNRHT